MEVYSAAFPHFTPSCFQQDVMIMTITDIDAWKDTVKFWALNDYRPQSIGKMLDYYAEATIKRNRRGPDKLPTVAERLAEAEADRQYIIAPPPQRMVM